MSLIIISILTISIITIIVVIYLSNRKTNTSSTGIYNSVTGNNTSIINCNMGYYVNSNKQCVKCPSNTYSNTINATGCMQCPNIYDITDPTIYSLCNTDTTAYSYV